MGDIFSKQRLYPFEGNIKDHFGSTYDAVYLAFLPFFKWEKVEAGTGNFKRAEQISLEQARQKDALFNKISAHNAEIYSYTNPDYPREGDIYANGKPLSWEVIIEGAGFSGIAELYAALLTSIGALSKGYQRKDLAERLEDYTKRHHIWHPDEGHYDLLSKRDIFRAFKLLGKTNVLVTDEFYENSFSLDLDTLTEWQFAKAMRHKDYYLYSQDRELLFTIEWDSFFFLIATSRDNMQRISSEITFEGFDCKHDTQHHWSTW